VPALETIYGAIRTLLVADAGAGGVNTLTGGRIYHMQAPKDAALPLLVYTGVAEAVSGTFTSDQFEFIIQFDVYGEERLGAVPVLQIADRVSDIMTRVNLSATGWKQARTEITGRGLASVEDEAVRVMQTYRIYADS